jgi:hypothetical protein
MSRTIVRDRFGNNTRRTMSIRVFDKAAVEQLLDGRELLDALEGGFVALSRGEVVAPMRSRSLEAGAEPAFFRWAAGCAP